MNPTKSIKDVTSVNQGGGPGGVWAKRCDGCQKLAQGSSGSAKRWVPGMGYRMVCAECKLVLRK